MNRSSIKLLVLLYKRTGDPIIIQHAYSIFLDRSLSAVDRERLLRAIAPDLLKEIREHQIDLSAIKPIDLSAALRIIQEEERGSCKQAGEIRTAIQAVLRKEKGGAVP
ncbi:MAG: hypothetical protein QXI19_03555 [Candidatus Caldarchaeum sp.]